MRLEVVRAGGLLREVRDRAFDGCSGANRALVMTTSRLASDLTDSCAPPRGRDVYSPDQLLSERTALETKYTRI